MKLSFAGLNSPLALDYTRHLFNCTRNPRCQKPFFIPVRSLQDIVLYMDLPGKPQIVDAILFNMCDVDCGEEDPGEFNEDFNNDFNIGGEICSYMPCPTVWGEYLIGQKPSGEWYGVFTDLSLLPNNYPKCFFFRFIFTINGQEYIYYSEQFCIEDCDPLVHLRGCYPNEPIGTDASDCNGVYYGYHAGEEEPLGNPALRYWHWAYVRKGSIIDNTAKLTFSFFNNRRAYRSVTTKEKLFEFELVPAFYKNVLLGIFARGNVRIEEVEYKLTQEQSWQVLSLDSKLWQMDTLLDDECELAFGCAPADCLPLPQACINPPEGFNYEFIGGESGDTLYTFFGGVMESGDSLQWELWQEDGSWFYGSGTITSDPWEFILGGWIDTTKQCLKMRWRKICHFGGSTDWQEQTFGLCTPVENVITGTIDAILTGGGGVGGPVKLIINFDNPLPGDIIYRAGKDIKATGGGYLNTSSGYPLPKTYPDGSVLGCGITDYVGGAGVPKTMPSGATYYETNSICTEIGAGFGYVEKVVFFEMTLPTGFSLALTPVRPNFSYEIR